MYSIRHSAASGKEGRIDWTLLGMYLLFVILGWLNIYAASFDLENAVDLFDLSGRAGMQLLWIGTSLVLAFALIKIDVSFYETYAMLLYALGIFLLILTLMIAPDIKGSRSWLVLGPVQLQPAEFMKFIIALVLAKVFNTYNFRLLEKRNLLLVSLLIFLPAGMVYRTTRDGYGIGLPQFYPCHVLRGAAGQCLVCRDLCNPLFCAYRSFFRYPTGNALARRID